MAGKGGNATKVILAALFGNGIIAIAKFVAFVFTGSSAMLAEGLHSTADTGNQVLIFLGLKRSQKPPDATHPYGYGKETYFWSFVVAISIFVLGGAYALYEGVHKLMHLDTASGVENPWWGFGVLGFSLALESYVFTVALKEFWRFKGDRSIRQALRDTREASLITVLFEDAAAVLGLLVALLGFGLTFSTQDPVYDAVATLLIGVILFLVAVFLGRMTKRLLIGQSASPREEEAIREAIGTVDGIEAIVELKTLHMGGEYILLNLGISFDSGLTTDTLETTIDRIEGAVKSAVPAVQRIFIEADSFRRKTETVADAPDVMDLPDEHDTP